MDVGEAELDRDELARKRESAAEYVTRAVGSLLAAEAVLREASELMGQAAGLYRAGDLQDKDHFAASRGVRAAADEASGRWRTLHKPAYCLRRVDAELAYLRAVGDDIDWSEAMHRVALKDLA